MSRHKRTLSDPLTGDHRAVPEMIRPTDQGVEIALRVQPKARRPGITGVHDSRIKVAVSAPPEDGQANRAVIRLMADVLDVAVSRIEIIRGTASRSKQLRVSGISADDARERLLS